MNIALIGGDYRTVKLIKLLKSDEHVLKVWGFDKCEELKIESNNNLFLEDDITKVINHSKVIIGPVPLSKDNEHVLSPYTTKKIKLNEFKKYVKDKLLLTGNIPNDFNENDSCVDLLKNEDLTIKNAIATAEGTIEILIKESMRTIFNSNILIIGYGRIGKILCDRLKGFKANVYCSARGKDLVWIETNGLHSISYDDFDKTLNMFDYIINTVPVMILNKERLQKVKQDTLIIDVASSPGGVNFEAAKQLNIKVLWELGIPGRITPISAAEYLREVIYKTIENKGEK